MTSPLRTRWQPLRCGLINIYRFDYEEFPFDNGRLLLRGNNGTGKSRVLALQLPFLLDGETAPHRLEPDGDPARRVEWNLLMGRYPDRLGYTWLEFGRSTPEGDEFCTLGCGLQAVEGRGLVNRWYFIARKVRLGRDLFLLNSQRTPHTRERLAEALGANGQIFTVAREYRAAVNAELFGLDEDRYEALLELLIALRQPQLSRKLDENRLSETLSSALPRIPERVVTDLSDSFRGLEADRQEVTQLEAVSTGLNRFQNRYTRYLQAGCRREADKVRQAHNLYELTQRKWREAETELSRLRQELEALLTRRTQVHQDRAAAEVRVQTLQESPHMQDARTLDHARQVAVDRSTDVERQERQLETVTRDSLERQTRFDKASERTRRLAHEVQASLERVVSTAQTIALVGPASDTTSQQRYRERLEQMKQGIRRLKAQNDALRRAEAAWLEAQRRQRALQSQVEEARDHARDLDDVRDARTDELLAQVRTWLHALQELRVDDPADDLRAWCLEGDDGAPDPLRAAVEDSYRRQLEELTTRIAQASEALKIEQQQRDDLGQERDRLVSGKYVPPPTPPGRDAESRTGRPGAPFYRLVDFQPHVSDTEKAGLEAALEAAGLLEAWVCPDGTVVSSDTLDAILVPSRPMEASAASVLRVCRDPEDSQAADVDDATTLAVLQCIGLGPGGETWIDMDGRWQMGPLQGRWAKLAAEHVGQGAREAARRSRLQDIERRLVEVEARMGQLERAHEALRGRQDLARQEAQRVPTTSGVQQVWADMRAAAKQIRALQARVAEAELEVFRLHKVAIERREERDDEALALGLTDWVERLDELQERLHECQDMLGRWQRAMESHAEAEAQRSHAENAWQQSREQVSAETVHRTELERLLQEAIARRDTLEATIGAAVAEVLRQLEAARAQAETLRREQDALEKGHLTVHGHVSRREGDVQTSGEAHARATEERETAIASLATLGTARVLSDVVPQVDVAEPSRWGPTRAVDIAREILAATPDTVPDDAAFRRLGTQVFSDLEELRSALLPYDHRPESDLVCGLVTVLIRYQNRPLTPTELVAEIGREIEVRQGMLTTREREIIENHLIGEIAQHLHDLLHRAEAWVSDMNLELEERPMSTGMKLRFRWEPKEDGPAGLGEARRRLMRMSATWSTAERQALGEFLQQQIRDARSQGDKTWQENLAVAMDYRKWHRFTVERFQDGQWRALTRRTHGTGSGGEKAIALTIPQFAAAAAYYHSADAAAPRLILLDEVFVGVDADMRGKCMALLEQFDLDFIMTSEREWGCYADIKGLAIAQLAARPGIDAVYVSHWVWTGEELLQPHYELPPLYAEQSTLFT